MKKINSKKVFNGIIINAFESQFKHKEKTLRIEQVTHPGGVCIAATHDNESFYLVKQYRFGIEKEILEFPAGLIDPNEDPQNTALRELQEEIGYEAKQIVPLGKLYASPGYLDEISYLYYAYDLKFVGQDLDENEDLEIVEIPLFTLVEMVNNHEISDAKTVALIYKLEHYLKKNTSL